MTLDLPQSARLPHREVSMLRPQRPQSAQGERPAHSVTSVSHSFARSTICSRSAATTGGVVIRRTNRTTITTEQHQSKQEIEISIKEKAKKDHLKNRKKTKKSTAGSEGKAVISTSQLRLAKSRMVYEATTSNTTTMNTSLRKSSSTTEFKRHSKRRTNLNHGLRSDKVLAKLRRKRLSLARSTRDLSALPSSIKRVAKVEQTSFVSEQVEEHRTASTLPSTSFVRRSTRNAGELHFSNRFESANLGRAIKHGIRSFSRTETLPFYDYELSIRPDTNNPKQRVWFYFTVSNARAGQRVIFHLHNYSKSRACFGHHGGLTPVVSLASSNEWHRLPSHFVFYHVCPNHNRMMCVSFMYQFPQTEDFTSSTPVHFALSFPYTYTTLQRFLKYLDRTPLYQSFYRRELLCRTVQNRRCDLITITSSTNLIVPVAKSLSSASPRRMRIVAITARVHPGETPASHVCHGLLDFLIGESNQAQLLRDALILCVTPMLNPDGVALGNYRCGSQGVDLNRMWLQSDARRYPTVRMTRELLGRLQEDPFSQLDLFIDIHAHTTCHNGFMYCNSEEPDKSKEKGRKSFPFYMANRWKDFDMKKSREDSSEIKKGTSRRALGALLPDTKCYTLEVSYIGSRRVRRQGETSDIEESDEEDESSADAIKTTRTPKSSIVDTYYSQKTYESIGKALGLALCDYYGLEEDQAATTTNRKG